MNSIKRIGAFFVGGRRRKVLKEEDIAKKSRVKQTETNTLFGIQDRWGYLTPGDLERFGNLVGKESRMYVEAERKASEVPLLLAILKENKHLNDEQLTKLGDLVGRGHKIYIDAERVSKQYRG